MQYGNVWISRVEDCDENEGGYFCQVYADSDMQCEIDTLCICPDMCDCDDEKEVEKYIAEYAKMYSHTKVFGKREILRKICNWSLLRGVMPGKTRESIFKIMCHIWQKGNKHENTIS